MAQQIIDIGSAPNDGTGDPIRDAFDKCNDNFTELYTALTGLVELKGSTDCSTNPNYPVASAGDAYRVSVAGKIGGASGVDVEVGDLYYALADNAGGTQASVGTSWDVLQGNITGSVGSGVDVEDEGVSETVGANTLNFVGAGVTAADAGGGQVDITIPGGGGGVDVEDEGVTETAGATVINFTGAGVTATDAGGGQVDVDIPGGGSFSGALVHKAADQTTANYSGNAVVAWDSDTSGYDTDSYHDTVTNNSRITIATTGKYIFRASILASSLTASDYVRMWLLKNGAGPIHGGFYVNAEISATPSVGLNGVSAVIDATAADYFEILLDTESDTSITVTAIGSWFSVERVS